ncbi:hypothetical protein [Mycobacterium deserti]|uniref:Uncharacterized protein n=1 Tax=Mycobacterium deserti TaxID=2978347 RepID=A0ABT2MDV3_9MYCO|nr:hypothetical protein [Mycobacterium deserti]MCT7659590.1 hypothetical protein [Mycobacterium deserti]
MSTTVMSAWALHSMKSVATRSHGAGGGWANHLDVPRAYLGSSSLEVDALNPFDAQMMQQSRR